MAFFKARVVYKNPEWIDGEKNHMEYHLTFDIVLQPPAEVAGVVQQEKAVAQRAVGAFWGGQYPLMPKPNYYIHPGRIISIEILKNDVVEVAQLDKQKVIESVIKK